MILSFSNQLNLTVEIGVNDFSVNNIKQTSLLQLNATRFSASLHDFQYYRTQKLVSGLKKDAKSFPIYKYLNLLKVSQKLVFLKLMYEFKIKYIIQIISTILVKNIGYQNSATKMIQRNKKNIQNEKQTREEDHQGVIKAQGKSQAPKQKLELSHQDKINKNNGGKLEQEVEGNWRKDFHKIQFYVKNQIYLSYANYLQIRQFYESSYASLKKSQVIPTNFLHLLSLLISKSYFLTQNYVKCIQVLEKELPLPHLNSPFQYSYKILYERQFFLLKSAYLLNQFQGNKFKYICEQYVKNKTKCTDWNEVKELHMPQQKFLQQYYDKLMKWVRKNSAANINANQDINNSLAIKTGKNIDEQNMVNGLFQKKVSIFMGIPVYLVETNWLKMALDYMHRPDKNLNPGPCMNFRLLNHIFGYKRHKQQHKSYTDTILFPLKYKFDYVALNRKQWKHLQSMFDGIEIKRVPIADNNFETSNDESNCLIKMMLQVNQHVLILQFQAGLLWEKSVISYLNQRITFGQLKQVKMKTSQNGEIYYEEELVKPGFVSSTKNRYRFTPIPFQMVSKVSQKNFQKLITKYNLQQFPQEDLVSLSQNQQILNSLTLCRVILKASEKDNKLQMNSPLLKSNYKINNKEIGQKLVSFHIKNEQLRNISQKLKSFSEILSVLYTIGTLPEFMKIYASSTYIHEMDKSWSQLDIQYAVAISDWIKSFWFSPHERPSIDCSNLANKIIEQSKLLQSKIKQQPHPLLMFQFPTAHPTCTALLSTLLPLYHFNKNHIAPDLNIYGSLQAIKDNAIVDFKKSHSSQIFNLFCQFHYEQCYCRYCDNIIGYRFVPLLCLRVLVQDQFQIFKGFIVSRKTLKSDKRKDVYEGSEYTESAKDIVIKNDQKEIGKNAIQFGIRVKNGHNLSLIFSLIQNKLNLIQKQELEDQKQSKRVLIAVLIQKGSKKCIQAGISNQKQPIQLEYLNELTIKTGYNLFIFDVQQAQVYALLIFRDLKTSFQKGFPQIIPIKLSFINSQQKIKEQIKSIIGNKNIKIKKLEINYNWEGNNKQIRLQSCRKDPGQSKRILKFMINAYVDTKAEPDERVPGMIYIEDQGLKSSSNSRKQSENIIQSDPRMSATNYRQTFTSRDSIFPQPKYDNKNYVTLQQCIYNNYCNKKPKPIVGKNQQKKQQFSQQKVHCDKCNKSVHFYQNERLLEFRKYIFLIVDRYKANKKYRICSHLEFPLQMSIKQFISQGKKKSVVYKLKSLVLSHPPKNRLRFGVEEQPSRYYTVVRGVAGDQKWTLYDADEIKKVNIQQLDGSRVEILLYERSQ